MNLKSVYRQIEFKDVQNRVGGPSNQNFDKSEQTLEMMQHEIATKINEDNLQENVNKLRGEIDKVTKYVDSMMEKCETRLEAVLHQADTVTRL